MNSSFRSGTTLGSYRILAPLGAGGMGEVYKAHDPRLDRAVALKILPAEVVRDPDRVRRFVQEARSASSLSHPNIVSIYDIGEAVPISDVGEPTPDSVPLHYIAMELVEGATLRQLLDDRSIEPRTLLAHLAQAAEGLAKAHAAGIVHRDLKPENIMVTRDGYTKLLDFGLAKLTEKEATGGVLTTAPTALPATTTQKGVVMGTVGYMSPEQATGRTVDHRTDVFAFGCLLYEAATGRKPFMGDSTVDVLHAIVREKPPPVEELAPQIPRVLVRMIRRCLAKDPDRRFQSMKDLALELHEMVDEWDNLATPSGPVSSSTSISGTAPPTRAGRGRKSWIAFLFAASVLAVAGLVFWLGESLPRDGTGAFRAMRISGATSNGKVDAASIGPDGRYLAYTRRGSEGMSLWLRQPATASDVQLVAPQGDRLVRNPVFTPDGNYIDYTLSDEMHNVFTLYRIPVLGGTPRKILADIDTPAAFSPDGHRIAFVRNVFPGGQRLVAAASDGGDETVIASRGPETRSGFVFQNSGLGPVWSPQGDTIAVPGWENVGETWMGEVVIVHLDDGSQHSLGDTPWLGLTGVAWVPDGSALVVAGIPRGEQLVPQLWRAPYPNGPISRITNDSSLYYGVSISADGGTLASVQSQESATLWRRTLLSPPDERQLTFTSREMIGSLAGSADGTVFFHYRREEESGIARLALQSGEPVRLTRAGSRTVDPRVSRDGRTVIVRSLLPDSHVVLQAMDADGDNVRNLPELGAAFPFILSPDGKFVIVRDERGLWREPLDDGSPTLLVASPAVMPLGFSPSGAQLAYLAGKSDPGSPPRPVIDVIPASGGTPTVELERPPGGVDDFRWAPDGKALTFRRKEGNGYNIWRLPLDGSSPTRVTDFDSVALGDYLFSEDGKTLTYTKITTTSDAVLISNFQ